MSDKGTIEQLHAELAQLRRQLAIPDQTCGYCGYRYSAGTNEANFAVLAEHIKSCSRHPLAKALAELAQARDELTQRNLEHIADIKVMSRQGKELTQARAELKDLQATDHQFGQQAIRRNRDYWYDKAVAAECERDEWRKKAQEQSDEVQEHWLSPAEAEGLRRQLADARRVARPWFRRAREAEPATAIKKLYEEHDQLVDRIEDAMRQIEKYDEYIAENHIQYAVEDILERLREAELVEQRHKGTIDELEQRLTRIRKRLAQAELEAHVHSKTCDELAQTVRTERAERQEAEQCAKLAGIELANGHRALETASVPLFNWGGVILSIAGRIKRLGQRAERAEALETAETALIAHINELDGRLEKAEQCAEALAALVTPELANLLVLLASSADTSVQYHRCTAIAEDTKTARELAAQIREALDDSQA